MSTLCDTDQTIRFLDNWKKGGPWVLCAFENETSRHEFRTFREHDELSKWLEKCNTNGWNVYFHPNSVRAGCGKASKDDVQSIDCLHVDIDPKKGQDLASERTKILDRLQNNVLLPKPTVIVFSGGGYQAFWRLQQPIAVSSLKECEEAERYNEQIQILLDADSCHSADHVMRLPGTVNFPNKKKQGRGQETVLARVVSEDWDLLHSLDKFTKAAQRIGSTPGSTNQKKVDVPDDVRRISADALELDPMFAQVTTRARAAIVIGHDEDQPLSGDNSRSEWLFYVVCELVRKNVPDEVVYSIITDPDFAISKSVLDKGNPSNIRRYALRQIQRAKEHNEEPWLERLNREYAVIESVGGKLRVARERFSHAENRAKIEFLMVDGFRTMWGNKTVDIVIQTANGTATKQIPVGKWWLEHPNRREYREVIFYPNHEFEDTMNMWRGFAYDAVPGDWSLFHDHIKSVVCHGNEEYYNYLIGWMAHAVQRPELAGQVAVVMRGGQGIGKGTFAKIFGKLFGVHYKYVSNSEHVTGNFNFMLHDAVMVFADECFAAKDKKSESALKSLITEDTIRVTPKGVDSMEARNCVHLIMSTNSDWAVSVDMDDRRFFVIEVDDTHRTDGEYFGKIHRQMDSGGYAAMLHYLTTYDLSGFDVRNCPKTQELRNQKELTMDLTPQGYLLELLTEGRLSRMHKAWYSDIIKEELLDGYRAYAGNHGTFITKSKMTRILRDIFQIGRDKVMGNHWVTWHDSRGDPHKVWQPRMYTFGSLERCRNMWESKFGPREWDDFDECEEEDEDAF